MPSSRTVTVSGRNVPCARTVRTPTSSRMMRNASAYSAATSDPPGPGLSQTSSEKCSAPIIRRHTSGSGAGAAVVSTDTTTRAGAGPAGWGVALAEVDCAPAPPSLQVATV